MTTYHPEVTRARVVADREGEMDVMTLQGEAEGGDEAAFAASATDLLKLKARIEVLSPGSLPNDGLVIEDRRKYD